MNDAIEIEEIKQFLHGCIPFDQLGDELLCRAARAVHITYHRQDGTANILDGQPRCLYMVRSGAVEIRDRDGELVDHVDRRGYFGYPSLLTGNAITHRAVVLEDCLLYRIDEKTFESLRTQNRNFDRFFNRAHAKRLHRVVRVRHSGSQMTQRIVDVMTQDPMGVCSSTSVQQAASMMTDARVSSLLVVDNGQLRGVITDRDLRSRVLARGIAVTVPVAEVMTQQPVSVQADAYVFEALMQMSIHNVHHLPVMRGDRLCGVLTATDIMKKLRTEPVYLIGEVSRQKNSQGLVQVAEKIPLLLRDMIACDARADDIGRVVTIVSDAITRQLINQAIGLLGEPPIPFAWLGFGSQGRQEQSAKSDQDNGLLLADDYSPAHEAYFRDLAAYVCDGLNDCGYIYCPGDVMAMTERWRQPLKNWQACFFDWIEQPTAKALMHASIFFDMRAVYGAENLFIQLQSSVLKASRNNTIFLACLVHNAIKNSPPLGLFRQFVVERNGEHKNTFDVKRRGLMPITDIARIYALACGSSEINTLKRLRAAADMKLLTLKDARNLADAYEYIAHLRLVHQGDQLRVGKAADNYLSPDGVSDLSKHQLRDAFGVVRLAQSGLKMKFTGGLL